MLMEEFCWLHAVHVIQPTVSKHWTDMPGAAAPDPENPE